MVFIIYSIDKQNQIKSNKYTGSEAKDMLRHIYIYIYQESVMVMGVPQKTEESA